MTHDMLCSITDGYRPNDVDTPEGDLKAIENSFRIDVEIARRELRDSFQKYIDDMSAHGGNFDLNSMLERIEDVMLDEFYDAKRQAGGS